MGKDLFERLLDYYQITQEQYNELNKDYTISNFCENHHFDEENEACELVKNHIKSNNKIAIYGDYDTDGIMSVSIICKCFLYLNYDNFIYYIPNRYEDEYGLSLKKAKEFKDKGVSLVITVDNGISAFKPISYLRENGIDVLILDHHQKEDHLPNANFILTPMHSHFSNINTSGGFTTFYFTCLLLGYFDKYLSILAAISVIGDSMSLIGVNRRFIRLVIKNYKKREFKNIDDLLENDNFDETSIGMKISPKINAYGRMVQSSKINDIVTYFIYDQKNSLCKVSDINENNYLRKSEMQKIIASIKEDFTNSKIIFFKNDGLIGLSGVIGNNLLNKYQVPIIVYTVKDGICNCSCRSPLHFSICDGLSKFSEFFISFGGHECAAGIKIEETKMQEFKILFSDYINKNFMFQEEKYIDFSIKEITKDNAKIIESFRPFGEGFKNPLLKICNICTGIFKTSPKDKIFRRNIGYKTILIDFNLPDQEKISNNPFADIYGVLISHIFNGREETEFVIKKIVYHK